MTEERERGEGDAVRTRVEENERNQERSKCSNGGAIMPQPNDPSARNVLKTGAVSMTIQDVGCQASTMSSLKVSTTNNSIEFKGFPEDDHLDVFRQKPVRITVKVNVPVSEHPKFNFVGKLLGPRGSSLKRLQERTRTRMAVFGSGSVRSRQKEEELLASGDPKYGHLKQPLHLQISALAPPAEAHLRIATALTEVRPYLIPDSNDLIRQRQRQELNESRPHTCSCTHPREPDFFSAAISPSEQQQWKGVCGGISECNSPAASAAHLSCHPPRPQRNLGSLFENPGRSPDSPGRRLPSVEKTTGCPSTHLADAY